MLGLIHVENRPARRLILRIQIAELEAAIIELAVALGKAQEIPASFGKISPLDEISHHIGLLLWATEKE
jgi:hypothetical protein